MVENWLSCADYIIEILLRECSLPNALHYFFRSEPLGVVCFLFLRNVRFFIFLHVPVDDWSICFMSALLLPLLAEDLIV